MTRILLRHLTFTGLNVGHTQIKFADGLNIIFGASNTGKSFTSKAILFMLGVSRSLPETEEIAAYDAVWLGITLPDIGDVTLYRATRGGHFKLYKGLINSAEPNDECIVLYQQHDSNRTNTVSYLLLNEMGFVDKWIVRDGSGTKDKLSIRLLSPYFVVSEQDILAERSPVLTSGTPSQRIFEQNLFKFLIMGIDDSSAVTVSKPSERKVAKAAKIEMVDELIDQINAEIGENPLEEKEIEEQLARLDQSANGLFARLQDIQKDLDSLITERRSVTDRCRELQERTGEIDLMLQRFAKLREVYNSDLQRLQSIEEGGYLLVAMAAMDCPVCGAPPQAQKHKHGAEEISMAHKAAAAEARKIGHELQELAQTITSLEADAEELRLAIDQITIEIQRLDTRIQERRPFEASQRESYEEYALKRIEITKVLELYQRRAKLVAWRAVLNAESTKRKGEALPVGPDSTTIFKFGETIKAVLTAWRFPNADKVQFDGETNDITVAGKRRAANGKGVRAILHAAFNVAVIVYCIENKLPYPGFLVLDTPLLTYREPMTSRHGELSEDEAALKATNLAVYFYKHLASLKNNVQFIVIENSDPPTAIRDMARIETFTGLEGNGRFGLLARSI